MAITPDRKAGPLQEDEEIQLVANAAAPSVAGAFNYDGTSFVFKDSLGSFNPRGAEASLFDRLILTSEGGMVYDSATQIVVQGA